MEILVKIQNELKVPKGNFNAFGKYKYRSAENILEAVKPVLLANKATLTLSDCLVLMGNKIFLKATATLICNGETLVTNGYAETSEHKGMSSEQTTGTASSYARKYALNGLFLIDETEADADNEVVKPKVEFFKFQKDNEMLIINAENEESLKSIYKSFSEDEQKRLNKLTTDKKSELTIK